MLSSDDDDVVIKFGSVDEKNDNSSMIMTKKYQHKCDYETKFKQCLTI